MDRVVLVAILALLAFLVYRVFAPFLEPLVWAATLVVACHPLHVRLERRLRRPTLAALVSTLVLTLALIVPALLILAAFVNQALEGVQYLQRAGWQPLLGLLDRLPLQRSLEALPVAIELDDIKRLVTEALRRAVGWVADRAGGVLRDAVVLLLNLFVTLLATFYLFRDGRALVAYGRDLLPGGLDRAERDRLLTIVRDVLFASVFSAFVVAAVQGALGGITFWALGLPAPVLWGIVMAVLSLLPLLGAWMVWAPAAVLLLLDGAWDRALALVVVGVLVIGTVDNVLRPYLISGRAQMSGLLVFIAVLGGIAAFGLVGAVLGPVLVAVAAAVLEAHREYLRVHAPVPASED